MSKKWYEETKRKVMCLYEKPSQVKAMKAVLPKDNKIKAVSLAGHIFRLWNPEEYNVDLKQTWFKLVKQKKIPYLPDEYKLKVKEKSTGKFKTDYESLYLSAARAMKEADDIILCTDPDNEGCALGIEVIEAAGCLDKVRGMVNMSKLDFHSLKKAIDDISTIPYYTMAHAGFARGEYDWSYGINHTILASVLFGGGETWHIGGVKLPIMKLVYDCDIEIAAFKPVPYWQFEGVAKHSSSNTEIKFVLKVKQDLTKLTSLQTNIGKLEVEIQNTTEEEKLTKLHSELASVRQEFNKLNRTIEDAHRNIFDKKMVREIEKLISNGATFKATNVQDIKSLFQSAPLPYSLTDLQAEAGNLYNFTPSKTLELCQKNYEEQIQSYPRTDCKYYSFGELTSASKIIPNLLKLSNFSNVNIPQPFKPKTGAFNDNKVTAHTALAPTTKEISAALATDRRQIYDLVSTRYLIQFMDKYEYDQTIITIDIDDRVSLEIKENVTVNKGWRNLYNPKNYFGFVFTDIATLPAINLGDEFEILSIKKVNLETRPRSRFTEFSLLKAMENIADFYTDLDGLEKGIGTPATRATILSALFKDGYLKRAGKIILPSDKLKRLVSVLPESLSSPKLRADMESKLQDIVTGKLTKLAYEDELRQLIKTQADELYNIAKDKKIEAVDKDTLPPSDAQLVLAKKISKALSISIPDKALSLKNEMTKFINEHKKKMKIELSEKQEAFIKNYCEDVKILEILEKSALGTMTEIDRVAVSKWISTFLRSAEFRQKRSKKAQETKKKNRESKLALLEKKSKAKKVDK